MGEYSRGEKWIILIFIDSSVLPVILFLIAYLLSTLFIVGKYVM